MSGMFRDAACSPVTDARVYLALDEQTNHVIAGTETLTDDSGLYAIELPFLPAASDPYGYYFLVVKKDGYETLVSAVTVGAFAKYQSNTGVLKQR
jgi:hypothetical protein